MQKIIVSSLVYLLAFGYVPKLLAQSSDEMTEAFEAEYNQLISAAETHEVFRSLKNEQIEENYEAFNQSVFFLNSLSICQRIKDEEATQKREERLYNIGGGVAITGGIISAISLFVFKNPTPRSKWTTGVSAALVLAGLASAFPAKMDSLLIDQAAIDMMNKAEKFNDLDPSQQANGIITMILVKNGVKPSELVAKQEEVKVNFAHWHREFNDVLISLDHRYRCRS